jgi:hypothetical protein
LASSSGDRENLLDSRFFPTGIAFPKNVNGLRSKFVRISRSVITPSRLGRTGRFFGEHGPIDVLPKPHVCETSATAAPTVERLAQRVNSRSPLVANTDFSRAISQRLLA